MRIYDWFQLQCHFCLIESVKANWDNFKILFDIFQLFCDCQIFIAAFCFYLFQAFPVTCLQFKIAFPIILINLIFVYDVDASISCAFFAFLYSQFNNLPYFIVYFFAFVCSLFRQSDVISWRRAVDAFAAKFNLDCTSGLLNLVLYPWNHFDKSVLLFRLDSDFSFGFAYYGTH